MRIGNRGEYEVTKGSEPGSSCRKKNGRSNLGVLPIFSENRGGY